MARKLPYSKPSVQIVRLDERISLLSGSLDGSRQSYNKEEETWE